MEKILLLIFFYCVEKEERNTKRDNACPPMQISTQAATCAGNNGRITIVVTVVINDFYEWQVLKIIFKYFFVQLHLLTYTFSLSLSLFL